MVRGSRGERKEEWKTFIKKKERNDQIEFAKNEREMCRELRFESMQQLRNRNSRGIRLQLRIWIGCWNWSWSSIALRELESGRWQATDDSRQPTANRGWGLMDCWSRRVELELGGQSRRCCCNKLRCWSRWDNCWIRSCASLLRRDGKKNISREGDSKQQRWSVSLSLICQLACRTAQDCRSQSIPSPVQRSPLLKLRCATKIHGFSSITLPSCPLFLVNQQVVPCFVGISMEWL